ncbi:pectin lyase fold/virulence factor [Baffinella frigidus]|nr:pectin lyase fold/virulence factor [Cryptophyta sp. CCMP2293]
MCRAGAGPALLLLSVAAAAAGVVNVNPVPDGAWAGDLAAAAAGDTVVFAPGRYTSCSAGGVELAADISLVGSGSGGANATVIDCGRAGRHFHVSANVSIRGLTLEGGASSADGGCVLVEGMASALTVTDSVLSNCSAAASGGAIAFRGRSLNLTRCSLTANVAAVGGAVHATGSSAELQDVSSVGNAASSGGGCLYLSGGDATILRATFQNNTAGVRGGAIVVAGGALSVQNATFSGNAVTAAGSAKSGLVGGNQ